MRYEATLNKVAHELHVKDLGDGTFEVIVDGDKHVVDACELDHGAVSLLVDTRSYSVEFDGDGNRVDVNVEDHVFHLNLLDERSLRLRAAGAGFVMDGPQTVAAPMPGKVVKLLCKVGDEVKEGQGLVVVEAMKMENELRSPKDGVVKEIAAREGVSVEGGAPLVVVE